MLPDVAFSPQARALGEALPRMDVAAFVGFAQRGPLHLPVPLADESEFGAIFGGSPRLALDPVSGRWVQGYLAATVRAFFANGGRRCWVVRVAGGSASANRFPVNGIGHALRGPQQWALQKPIFVQARSEGSWSDALLLRANIASRAVSVIALQGRAPNGLTLQLRASPPLVDGDLLRIEGTGAALPAFAPLSGLRTLDDGSQSAWVDQALQLAADGSAAQDVGDTFIAAVPHQARVLNLELLVADLGSGSVQRVQDLGLTRSHASDWRRLGSDSELYAPGARPTALAALRFPIAVDASFDAGFDLPCGPSLGDPGSAVQSAVGAWQRDGLATYDASFFLDPGLATTERSLLLEQADQLRYTGAFTRPLRGLHALLGDQGSSVQDEVTLIAVPDAVHRPWAVVGSGSASPLFSELPVATVPEQKLPTFNDCTSLRLPAPAWLLSACKWTGDKLQLTWQAGPDVPGLSYLLQADASPDLGTPDTLQTLIEPTAVLIGREVGDRFVRVRSEADGCGGDWSSVLRIHTAADASVEIQTDVDEPALWPVHCAALRLAAARGDVLALLGLPASWREDAALQHARRLMALDADQAFPSTGSFGALYHPWSLAADGSQGLVATPPDGLVGGVLARRARERGAWVAPANEALRGIVALTPPMLKNRWQALQDGRVNLLRREPAAFVVLSESTLASEDELSAIHVRRLLSLLRRLATRIGAEFVFEPNDVALRLSMQSRFEHALDRLYRRGAFAGARVADAFQVAVLADARDATQLIVEIRVRVAPALRLITLRLAQSGVGASVAELL